MREATATTAMCAQCRVRPATEHWVGNGGVMGYIHGAYELWCKPCVVRAQLKHARESASRVAALKAQLASMLGEAQDAQKGTK